jgi:hypothetical protein
MSNTKKLTREGVIDPDEIREVTLGQHEYAMLPQPLGYLRSQLGLALGNLENIDIEANSVVGLLTERGYAILKVFIPEFMPEWEFNGFPTKEAWQSNQYDREYDHSPTPKEIKKAFIAGAELNEIDLLKHLGKVIGPDLLKGLVVEALQKSMKESGSSSTSSAPSTPPSTPESSSTPSPTSLPGPALIATGSQTNSD